MSIVIRVEKVSKRYRLGVINRQMLYQDLQSRWARWRGRDDPNAPVPMAGQNGGNRHEDFWALQDVSFEVREGDVVGIIGRNGSGKSTLLKILSGITAPTTGRVYLKGRLACLLEVGTGFHPELTGRENVFLNGAILGMNRAEIARKFDEIIDFAAIEEFIDTPVKRYSSGMTVRLAFAVAAHLEPEILVIDEVLAVGDAAFQRKCLGKMNAVAREGRTILFVSHQAAAVENLCTRGVVLGEGRLNFDGSQTAAISYYVNQVAGSLGSLRDRQDRSGNGLLRIVKVDFRDTHGQLTKVARSGEDIDVCLHFENYSLEPLSGLVVGVYAKTVVDVPVFIQDNNICGQPFTSELPQKGYFRCRLHGLPLPSALLKLSYYVTSFHAGSAISLDAMQGAAEVQVEDGDFFGTGRVPKIADGHCLLKAEWSLQTTEPHPPAEPQLASS